jgi:O-antigen/teichoic acid export membrane protein
MEKASSSRTKKALLNATTGIAGHLIILVLTFVGRIIFIHYLGVELLGVNGLFTGILQFLSLAELGLATAITFALYKPLTEKNERKIAAIMRHLARIYMFIGFVVLVIGLALLPALPFLINGFEELGISHGQLVTYFLIFLATNLVQYFVSYKRIIIIADQKKYVVNIITTCFTIASRTIQILTLVIWQNFIIYLLVTVIAEWLVNVVIYIIANKRYPYLKQFKDEKLTGDEKKLLYSNTGALAIARVSSVFTTGITPIIISFFIGITAVGLLSNYLLVTTAFIMISSLIFEALNAGVGNFVATESKEKQIEMFKKILYINAFFTILIFTGLLLLFNDFVEIWLGGDMVLNIVVPIMMAFHLYAHLFRNTAWVLNNAYGLYRHCFYRAFIEVAVFLAFAIPGAIYFGIAGVMFARLIAILIAQIPFEIYVVCKKALHKKVWFYYRLLFKYLLITIVIVPLCFVAIYFIPSWGVWGFILKMGIVISIVVGVVVLFTFRSDEFKYFKNKLFRKAKA